MCDSITIIIFKLLTFLFRCHFLTTTYPAMDHIYRIILIILSYGCQLQGKIFNARVSEANEC